MADDNPLIGPKDPTPPFGLTYGDRVILEKRIENLQGYITSHVDARSDEANRFYATRMLPLEQEVAKLRTVVWFAVGLAVASLSVQLIRIIAMIVLGRQPV